MLYADHDDSGILAATLEALGWRGCVEGVLLV